MEFICLDKEYQNPIWLRPLNVQWNAKHYEAGDFSIQIPTNDYEGEEQFAYVYCDEREQMGMIQKVTQQESLKGKFTQIWGFFMEKMLHDFVITEPVSCVNRNICEYVIEIVRKFDDQDEFVFDDYSEFTDTITSQLTEGYLDNVLFELLKCRKISYRIYYDFVAEKLHFKFVKGKDRTQSQTINNTIVFSEELKNLKNLEFNSDSSNYKNYAYIIGGDSEENPTKVILDIRKPGERRKEICVNASDIKLEEGMTQEEFIEQLTERGKIEISNYSDIKNIAFDTENDLIRYLEDYDLGDVADVIIVDMGQAYESEIIEVDEVIKKNTHTITIVLGDKIPRKY